MNLSIIENLDFRSELQAGLEPATFSLRMNKQNNCNKLIIRSIYQQQKQLRKTIVKSNVKFLRIPD